jgi:P-type E1-E2 ATPase
MVPETLKDFISANIKVFMLTGDKLETAENIGKSCNLVAEDMIV